MTNLKRYTAESCHEIGYSWIIDAPQGLTSEDVEKLQDCLVSYTDTPDTAQMLEMLDDINYCDGLDVSKLELFKQVVLYVESVHRETFTQSFREDKE